MGIINNLNWRYATKRMTGKVIPQQKIEIILESIRLSPSSYGLQPYEILVIHNSAVKEVLSEIAFHQPQVKECSHLLVFAAWSTITEEKVRQYIELISKERNEDASNLSDFGNAIIQNIASRNSDNNFQWAAKQTYIALGLAILAAAENQIDTAPLEGFDSEKLDQEMGLYQRGLRSTVMLALGYRDFKNDSLLPLKKVRRPIAELFTHIH